MKILLAACNAKYIHSNLAVYDLKAYSSDYDKEVLLREYTINQPKDEILKDIYGSESRRCLLLLLYLEYFVCTGTDS